VLPAIQVQTLNGLKETISVTVNDLTREAWAWTEHPSTVKLVGVLQLDFLSEIRDFGHFGGHNSFSRSACERPPNVHLT